MFYEANLDAINRAGIALPKRAAAWQYTHHVLPGLLSHRGPILTVANWSGHWPSLVGLLNLNGSLVKAGKKFSSIWSTEFYGRILPEWAG